MLAFWRRNDESTFGARFSSFSSCHFDVLSVTPTIFTHMIKDCAVFADQFCFAVFADFSLNLARDIHTSAFIIIIIIRIQGVWPTFGSNARLCKKWISCHLLSGHFADEIIELLLVSLYINPEPFQVSKYVNNNNNNNGY